MAMTIAASLRRKMYVLLSSECIWIKLGSVCWFALDGLDLCVVDISVDDCCVRNRSKEGLLLKCIRTRDNH